VQEAALSSALKDIEAAHATTTESQNAYKALKAEVGSIDELRRSVFMVRDEVCIHVSMHAYMYARMYQNAYKALKAEAGSIDELRRSVFMVRDELYVRICICTYVSDCTQGAQGQGGQHR
jgi:hypothetical protein